MNDFDQPDLFDRPRMPGKKRASNRRFAVRAGVHTNSRAGRRVYISLGGAVLSQMGWNRGVLLDLYLGRGPRAQWVMLRRTDQRGPFSSKLTGAKPDGYAGSVSYSVDLFEDGVAAGIAKVASVTYEAGDTDTVLLALPEEWYTPSAQRQREAATVAVVRPLVGPDAEPPLAPASRLVATNERGLA